MTLVLRMQFWELPPSSNKIYFGSANNRRLSTKAKEYAERFSEYAIRHHLPDLNVIDKDNIYAIHLIFFMPSLINQNFYENKPPRKNKAGQEIEKTRYKKIDLSNHVKLLEDCVRDFLQVDDSHTFAASQEKIHAPEYGENGMVEILVQEVDPARFSIPPLPAFLLKGA